MKIAVISNQARSMLNFRGPLLAEMHRCGHEIMALAPDFDADTRAAFVAIGAQPVEFSMSRAGVNPIKEMSVILELRNLLRQHQPDVCFTFFLKPVIYGTIAAWSVGIKKKYGLIEGLGFAFTSGRGIDLRRWFTQRLLMLAASFATARLNKIIFLNADDMSEFERRGLVTPPKGALLGAIGVDLDEWTVEPLPSEEVTFILVARLLRDKGVREYAAAARILRTNHLKARFLLVGGLDENPAAISRAEVEAWVSEGLIEWPGHVAVKPWLARSSVFVLPSYREGLPRSTQEAMALGRAVITTDVPGCRETVVHGRNGFLVPVRDPAALANAMQHFIKNPEDIPAMGAESRRIAEERFDVNVQNKKLMGFMELCCTPSALQ